MRLNLPFAEFMHVLNIFAHKFKFSSDSDALIVLNSKVALYVFIELERGYFCICLAVVTHAVF